MFKSDYVYSNNTSVNKSEEEESFIIAVGGNYMPNQHKLIVSSEVNSEEGAEGRLEIDDSV